MLETKLIFENPDPNHPVAGRKPDVESLQERVEVHEDRTALLRKQLPRILRHEHGAIHDHNSYGYVEENRCFTTKS